MNILRKIADFLDKVPADRTLSIRQQITLFLWTVTIIFMPFISFPYGIFKSLTAYPLWAIALLNIDKWGSVFSANKYLRNIAIGIAVFLVWQVAALPLCISWDEIAFKNIYPSFNYITFFGAWYIFLASCFLLPYEKITKAFYWGLTITFSCCAAYSVIEILHFCDVQWATEFLEKAIYCFISDVGMNHGWWPPVFWDTTRLRSVFPEPSFFTPILIFSMFYYGFCAWKTDKWYKVAGNSLLMISAALLLCGTRSASGTLAAVTSTIFFLILLVVFFRKLALMQKIKGSVLALAFIGLSAGVVFCQRGGFNDWQQLSDQVAHTLHIDEKNESGSAGESAPEQVTTAPPVVQIQEKDVMPTSSSTRFIHLTTELQIIARHPICGSGQGTYGTLMKEGLTENPEKTWEILLWIGKEDHFPPPLNKYTAITLEYGIIGLALFILIFSPIFICCIRTAKNPQCESWISSLVLIWSIAQICCTICSSDFFSCTGFIILPCCFFLNEAKKKELPGTNGPGE